MGSQLLPLHFLLLLLLLLLSLLFLQLDLLNYSIISKSIGNIRLRRTCRLCPPSSPLLLLILGCFILSSFRPYNQLDTYERASTRHTRSLGKHISFSLPLSPPPPRLQVQWGKTIRHVSAYQLYMRVQLLYCSVCKWMLLLCTKYTVGQDC